MLLKLILRSRIFEAVMEDHAEEDSEYLETAFFQAD